MTEPEKVNLSWTPLGNVFISETNPSTAYIRAVVVEKMLKEQREACVVEVKKVCKKYYSVGTEVRRKLIRACLNATGESDE